MAAGYEEAVASRSSGRPTAFGWTSTGRFLAAVFEIVEADVPSVYPVTAYEAPARQEAKKKEAMNDKPRKKIELTAEQRAQHQAIRDAFRDWHPGPEELIASGAAAELDLNVLHAPARELLAELKRAREAAGLTLAEVSRRCRIDQPALSRLENGRNANPTIETLWKYAAALGKRLLLSAEDLGTADRLRPNVLPRRSARRRKKS